MFVLIFFFFSPCLIGMLWNVISLDTDNIARAMLNVWLPGNPIDLSSNLIFNLNFESN